MFDQLVDRAAGGGASTGRDRAGGRYKEVTNWSNRVSGRVGEAFISL